MSQTADLLQRLVTESWPDAAPFWERAERELGAPEGVGFRALLASVPRRLGRLADARPVPPSGFAAARPHWTLTDYVRAALIARAFERLPSEGQPDVYLRLFEAGELGEQVSLLRTIGLLSEPARFLETALQACRTNARDVFEAIVCENPFLAEHFPALNFNQAVMKAIFTGVSIQRIEGLTRRITPELSRMALDYASERRAAGRPVPDDATYLLSYGA